MKKITIFLSFLWAALVSQGALAQSFVDEFGDWSVFTVQKDGQKICYIASAPVKQTGNYARRGEAYVLVTDRGISQDEVSVASGYPYQVGSAVTVEIDTIKQDFFSQGELAWAYDETADRDVVAAMKRGSEMRVHGTSVRGTFSYDTYSLKGVSAAYDKMKDLCR